MMRKFATAFVLIVGGTGFSTVASAEIFTIAPGSVVQLSGSVFVDIQNGVASGSGPFAAQGPNGLDGALSGTIVANASGGSLSFPGGSQIDVANSGPGQPNNLPGAFGFTAHADLIGPLPPNSYVDFVGNIRDLKFDLVGSTALSGPAGNQTFSTTGLELVTLSGFLSGQVTACAGLSCDTATIPEESLVGPPNPPLEALQGTLVTNGDLWTLSVPLRISSTETQSDTVQGVTVTVTLSAVLASPALTPIVATAVIPEPSTWALISFGLLGLALSARRMRATGHRNPGQRQ